MALHASRGTSDLLFDDMLFQNEKKVLIVEDNIFSLTVLGKMFKCFPNTQVTMAASGQEAITCVQA